MTMDTSVKIILVKYMELEQVFFFWIENNSTIIFINWTMHTMLYHV